MATTGWFFTLFYPLCLSIIRSENRYPLFRIMLQATKKPRNLIGRGLRFKIMRSFDYARTAPEARRGFPVFVVAFAVVFMAAEHNGRIG
jgi:hypothetical protein